jgi:hypothetical protein
VIGGDEGGQRCSASTVVANGARLDGGRQRRSASPVLGNDLAVAGPSATTIGVDGGRNERDVRRTPSIPNGLRASGSV